MKELRIVSLLPSATEIIHALGLGEHLVGVSHCCDFPEQVQSLPILTESVVDTSLPSEEIDRLTKEALGRGESLYRLNESLLRELRPSLVVTQALCDVCAVSFPSVARAVGELAAGTELVSLEPGCIQEIFDDILRVARATQQVELAEHMIADAQARLDDLTLRLRGVKRPRVLTLEWFAPAYYGGHWVPEQVEIGGGVSVMGSAHARSSGVSWEDIAKSDPDVIVCMPCGYDTQTTRELLKQVEHQQFWCKLRAVKQGQVWCVDANAYFSRPGPRVVSGAELIGHILHPQLVPLPDTTSAPIRVDLS